MLATEVLVAVTLFVAKVVLAVTLLTVNSLDDFDFALTIVLLFLETKQEGEAFPKKFPSVNCFFLGLAVAAAAIAATAATAVSSASCSTEDVAVTGSTVVSAAASSAAASSASAFTAISTRVGILAIAIQYRIANAILQWNTIGMESTVSFRSKTQDVKVRRETRSNNHCNSNSNKQRSLQQKSRPLRAIF